MQSFIVEHGGAHSILVDKGRFGYAHLGLTQGGPADEQAFYWLHRLLGNNDNSTVIECNLGGLVLRSTVHQTIAVTGANAPLTINGQSKISWCSYRVAPNDIIKLGYASSGSRVYLGVNQGFDIAHQFGSSSTVVREKIGGLTGNALAKGDVLPVFNDQQHPLLAMPRKSIPMYRQYLTLRIILGSQQALFSEQEKTTLFNRQFQVSKQANRMGYRLEGPDINVSSDSEEQKSITSEGIAFGAVQVPPNGQPIVLLTDRQTLGGYPKLGAILSLDAYRLAQCNEGALIHFEEISLSQANSLLEDEREQRKLPLLKH